MPGWENWIIGLSVAVIAIVFVVLAIYLITTLLAFRTSLKETNFLIRNSNDLVNDIERKVHSLDPLFNKLSDITETIEKKPARIASDLAEEIDRSGTKERKRKVEGAVSTVAEVAEWALLGLAIWQKIKERR